MSLNLQERESETMVFHEVFSLTGIFFDLLMNRYNLISRHVFVEVFLFLLLSALLESDEKSKAIEIEGYLEDNSFFF